MLQAASGQVEISDVLRFDQPELSSPLGENSMLFGENQSSMLKVEVLGSRTAGGRRRKAVYAAEETEIAMPDDLVQ
jgi:hypothetical protein